MIDHAIVKTTPALFAATTRFYELALAPLGYKKLREVAGRASGFGEESPDFWVFANEKNEQTTHIALRAKDRDCVRKFHAAAIEAGAKDNGAPGIREQIHPNFYGAFVHDLAGNNIEAVCHNPEK